MALLCTFVVLRGDGAVLPYTSATASEPAPIGHWQAAPAKGLFLINATLTSAGALPAVWRTRLHWDPPSKRSTDRLVVPLYALDGSPSPQPPSAPS